MMVIWTMRSEVTTKATEESDMDSMSKEATTEAKQWTNQLET